MYHLSNFSKTKSKKNNFIIPKAIGLGILLSAGLLINKKRIKGYFRNGKFVNSYSANRTEKKVVEQIKNEVGQIKNEIKESAPIINSNFTVSSGIKPSEYALDNSNIIITTKLRNKDYGYIFDRQNKDLDVKAIYSKIYKANSNSAGFSKLIEQDVVKGIIVHDGKQYKYAHYNVDTGKKDFFGRDIRYMAAYITDKDVSLDYLPNDTGAKFFKKQNYDELYNKTFDSNEDYRANIYKDIKINPVKIKATENKSNE